MQDRIDRIAKRIAADEEKKHDISVDCYYDSISAEEIFKDCFQALAYDRDGASVLLYKEDGQEREADDVLEISDYEKYGESFDEEYKTSYRSIANDLWPDDIIAIVKNVCTLDEVSDACVYDGEDWFMNWGEFEEWIKNQDEYGWNSYDWLWELLPAKASEAVFEEMKKNVHVIDFKYILDEINFWRGGDFEDVGLRLKPGWTWYKSRGYSQGDACIVICTTGLNESDVDHWIWDLPIYCRVEIDGEEMYPDSEMANSYSYDKNEILSIVKNHMGDSYDEDMDRQLNEMVPEEPEYI